MTEHHKNKFFNKSNLFYLLFSTCFTLLIGRILEPLFSYLFSKLLGTGGALVNWISNLTYRQISNGHSEQTASVVLSFFVILFFIAVAQLRTELKTVYEKYVAYWYALNAKSISAEKTYSDSPQETPKAQKEPIPDSLQKAKIFYIVGNAYIVFILCYVLFSYGQISHVNSRISMLTTNIETVSPYISDLEYKYLKSKFHSMENRDDYNNLISELTVLGESYSLKLKK